MRTLLPEIVAIDYRKGIEAEGVKKKLASLGARAVDRKIDDLGFVYTVPLTEEQKERLREDFPSHHSYLRGEVLIWTYDHMIAVHQNLRVYDPKCGKSNTGIHYLGPAMQTEEQRTVVESLIKKLESELGS